MSYKDSTSNGEIELSISDLGFIRWNDKTSNMHIESQYEFEGINVDDFISFSDSIIRNEIDSFTIGFTKQYKGKLYLATSY